MITYIQHNDPIIGSRENHLRQLLQKGERRLGRLLSGEAWGILWQVLEKQSFHLDRISIERRFAGLEQVCFSAASKADLTTRPSTTMRSTST